LLQAGTQKVRFRSLHQHRDQLTKRNTNSKSCKAEHKTEHSTVLCNRTAHAYATQVKPRYLGQRWTNTGVHSTHSTTRSQLKKEMQVVLPISNSNLTKHFVQKTPAQWLRSHTHSNWRHCTDAKNTGYIDGVIMYSSGVHALLPAQRTFSSCGGGWESRKRQTPPHRAQRSPKLRYQPLLQC
jgi:hypothetical protein